MALFDDYKFHPSSLGLIMTNDRSGRGIGETCIKHLVECYVGHAYGREKTIENDFIEKGNLVEEDSITLYSLVTKKFYKKNKEQIENDFLIGTPDLFTGPDIRHADTIKDIKSSWDIFTFFANLPKATNKKYEWQLWGYEDLTGAKDGALVYCLVNTPSQLVEDKKRWLARKMGVIDEDMSPEYQAACEQIDKLSVYDDIPKEKRYFEFEIKRDQEKIEEAHARVKACREIMNSWV